MSETASLVDQLLDRRPVLGAPSTILIGGSAGVGKTVAIAQATDPARTLWVLSAPGTIRAVAQLVELSPEAAGRLGVRVPEHRIVIPATVPGRAEERLPNRKLLHELLCELAKDAAGGGPRFPVVVFSNWDVFCARVYDELVEEKRELRKAGKKVGQLDHVVETKAFATWVYDVFKANGITAFFEVNERPPKYDDDESSPRYRQMLAKRGPNMPVYTMIESVVNEAEAYIRLQAGIGGKRRWQLRETHDTYAKLRGFTEPPFVEGLDRKAEDMTLAELMALAGVKL